MDKLDKQTTVEKLKNIADDFRKARGWGKHHNPKELALALSIEVSELLEHFRFQTQEEIKEKLADASARLEISNELADIQYLVSLLSIEMDMDLVQSSKTKFGPGGEAEKKYPIKK